MTHLRDPWDTTPEPAVVRRTIPGRRVSAVGGEMRVTFPYDAALVARIKTIPGRRWRPDSKVWTVPVTLDGATALLDLIEDEGFAADETAMARLTGVAGERARNLADSR